MNEEQKKFWDALSRNYPKKRNCRNCAYWGHGMNFSCFSCDSNYSSWEWDPGAVRRVRGQST